MNDGLFNTIVENMEIFLGKIQNNLARLVCHADWRDYFIRADPDFVSRGRGFDCLRTSDRN